MEVQGIECQSFVTMEAEFFRLAASKYAVEGVKRGYPGVSSSSKYEKPLLYWRDTQYE